MKKYKGPVLFSGMSLAAAIALFVGVIWPSAAPQVYAARITETLARQSRQNPLIHVRFESLAIDEVRVDGEIHVGPSGTAGDLRLTVRDDEGPLNINAAVAITAEGGWLLLRELTLPDPQAQAVLGLFLPPGQETLVFLPKNSEIAREISGDLQDGLRELQSGQLIAVFKELIEKHAEYGATVENQPDGTVRLVLPMENEEALEALAQLVERVEAADRANRKPKSHGHDTAPDVTATGSAKAEAHQNPPPAPPGDAQEAGGLIGATLRAVYDPASETVRMLSITGLGEAQGSITVTLGEGDLDPALLDSNRVANPGTRTLDLAGITSMIEGLKHDHD